MVNMLNNSLDKLINDLENLEEGKRARELAIFLKNKYHTIDEIDNHKDDPMVSEFTILIVSHKHIWVIF